MRTRTDRIGVFRKVAECLYRYSSNGVYYARIKTDGKEIRRSLETTDRQLANRNLKKLKEEQSQIDRSKSKMTLAELCERYLSVIQHQKPKTIERKTLIVRRIKTQWPGGSLVQISKVNQSDVLMWHRVSNSAQCHAIFISRVSKNCSRWLSATGLSRILRQRTSKR
jgi:hypothetical protein